MNKTLTNATSSLLFTNGVNLNAGGTVDISANKNNTETTVTNTHTDIDVQYGSLLTNAAISGALAGTLSVASESVLAASKGSESWKWLYNADEYGKGFGITNSLYPGLGSGLRFGVDLFAPKAEKPESEYNRESILVK